MIKKFFKWVFKEEFEELELQIKRTKNAYDAVEAILQRIDVSVDVHEYDHKYSPSWAVISIQGQRSDYIRFVNLADRDVVQIEHFLKQYQKVTGVHFKVDAATSTSTWLRLKKN